MALADEIQELNLEGFQVVSSDFFDHYHQRNDIPTITLWNDQIAFSKASVKALNNCERVRMEINAQTRGILLIPVSTKDKDGIKWMTTGKDPHGRKIDCKGFTEKLYETWEWKKDHVYRANGRIVVADQKIMLFFDFSSPVCWPYGSKTQVQAL